MDLDAPFPIDQCRARVRNVILAEFQGRTPTLRKVISISDREWLKMPGMGPGNLEELRRITRRKLGEIPPNKIISRSLSTLPVDELLPGWPSSKTNCALLPMRSGCGPSQRGLRAPETEASIATGCTVEPAIPMAVLQPQFLEAAGIPADGSMELSIPSRSARGGHLNFTPQFIRITP
jgi:hypothetical protein